MHLSALAEELRVTSILTNWHLANEPKELTDGKKCALPSVTWPRKSDREEQIRSNFSYQKITVLTTW